MKLEELLESLEKAAEANTKPAETDDKTKVSKELDALLSKEAAEQGASQAIQMGEQVAKSILEKLASQALEEATKEVEAKPEATATPVVEESKTIEVEKVAEEKKEEVKPEVKVETETKEVEKKAEEVKTETNEEDMNKQAQEAGKSLAEAILKAAAEANNGPTGPGKIQQDHAKSVAQDDAKIGPTPGRNGTVSQLFDAIVAKAKAVSNPAHEDQMVGGPQAPHEAKDQAMGTPSIPASPDIVEKQAAVQALCEAGLDWETAVDLVKSAAEEIAREEIGQVKQAAVEQLMKEGMDFETAVESVWAAVQEVTSEETKK